MSFSFFPLQLKTRSVEFIMPDETPFASFVNKHSSPTVGNVKLKEKPANMRLQL